jgi:hypothetical protein
MDKANKGPHSYLHTGNLHWLERWSLVMKSGFVPLESCLEEDIFLALAVEEHLP